MINIPATAKIKISEIAKLQYGKYPFSVTIKTKLIMSQSQPPEGSGPVSRKQNWRYYRLPKNFVDSLPASDQIKAVLCIDPIIYFLNASDVQKFVDDHHDSIVNIMMPPSSDALTAINDDHTLVYRNDMYYGKFEWRIELDKKSSQIKSSTVRKKRRYPGTGRYGPAYNSYYYDMTCLPYKEAAELFGEDTEGDVYQCNTTGCTPIIYFRDEGSVIQFRLASTAKFKKVEKVVINNKNNKGSTDASPTLQEVS